MYNQWISVEADCPSEMTLVLIATDTGHMAVAWYDENNEIWFFDGRKWNDKKQGRITHWQPLPSLPNKK